MLAHNYTIFCNKKQYYKLLHCIYLIIKIKIICFRDIDAIKKNAKYKRNFILII